MTDAQHLKIGMVGLGRMGANMARRLLLADPRLELGGHLERREAS